MIFSIIMRKRVHERSVLESTWAHLVGSSLVFVVESVLQVSILLLLPCKICYLKGMEFQLSRNTGFCDSDLGDPSPVSPLSHHHHFVLPILHMQTTSLGVPNHWLMNIFFVVLTADQQVTLTEDEYIITHLHYSLDFLKTYTKILEHWERL